MRTVQPLTKLVAACVVCVVSVGVGFGASPAVKPDPKSIARQIDTLIKQYAAKQDAKLPGPISDAGFLRRVCLDIVGKTPTPEQLTLFVLNPDTAKRDKIVQALLATVDYAQNWARYWRDVILYRVEDRRMRILLSGMVVDWFTGQLVVDCGWDEIASQLITAAGDVEEQGSNALIVAHMAQPERLAAETSRLFLGIRLQCAQCHDHPYDEWKREQFHELAAFFPRVGVRRGGKSGKGLQYIVYSRDNQTADLASLNSKAKKQRPLEHYMPDLKDPKKLGTMMQPVLFATDHTPGQGLSDVKRRQKLAESITSTEHSLFAQAYVNRIWAEMLGTGFVEPVDDMGPKSPKMYPRVLDLLANSLRTSGFSTKWLIRTIAATEIYQSRLQQPITISDDSPPIAIRPTRLRGEQLADSLSQVLGTDVRPSIDPRRYLKGGGPRTGEDLVRLFESDPALPKEEVNGTVPQVLYMMNSPVISAAISGAGNTALATLLQKLDSNRGLVFELYLRVLAREPSDAELAKCLNYIDGVEDRQEACEDIMWCLINSAEFLLNR